MTLALNRTWRELTGSPWSRRTRTAYSDLEQDVTSELMWTAAVNLLTKLMLVMTRVRMQHFTRQYKDTLQRRLTVLMHFVPNLSRYTHTNNYSNMKRFDEVTAKIKWCSFFLPHSVHI